MFEPRRVVVTGLGLITPVGIGTEASWAGLLAGRSGIGSITSFDAGDFPTRIAGQVEGFVPENFVDVKDVKKMDVFIQFAGFPVELDRPTPGGDTVRHSTLSKMHRSL